MSVAGPVPLFNIALFLADSGLTSEAL